MKSTEITSRRCWDRSSAEKGDRNRENARRREWRRRRGRGSLGGGSGIPRDALAEVIEDGQCFRVRAGPGAAVDGGGGAVREEDSSSHDRKLPFAEGLDNEGEVVGVVVGEACRIFVEAGEAGGEDLGVDAARKLNTQWIIVVRRMPHPFLLPWRQLISDY